MVLSKKTLTEVDYVSSSKVRYSERFGEIIGELLQKYNLSYAQATIRANGGLNRSYWSSLRAGLVPSRDKLVYVAEAFPEEPELIAEMFMEAGYAPPHPPQPEWLPLGTNREILRSVDLVSRRRNLAKDEVIATLLREELDRLGIKDEDS